MRQGSGYNFPSHWGPPPTENIHDKKEQPMRLPENYGTGSRRLNDWIESKIYDDKNVNNRRETFGTGFNNRPTTGYD